MSLLHHSALVKLYGETQLYFWKILRATHFVPDKWYVKAQYCAYMSKRLNIERPRSFNEKLQWIKLYDRKQRYTTLVDKYKVKEYVSEKIGERYVVPLLGVWEHFEEIDFDQLPDQFVLKCTHDSGSVMICEDKKSFNIDVAREKLEDGLAHNYFYRWREWPYKDVKPRIIAEKYLDDENGDLEDYKVLCFNGKAAFIQLHRGRHSNCYTQDYYNTDWVLQPFNQKGYYAGSNPEQKPEFLEEMLHLSEVLAEGIPHIRVDWYYNKGQLYLGELTFFDAAGYAEFVPDEVDLFLGGLIKLPEKQTEA